LESHSHQLGDCVPGVLPDGSGKQDWLCEWNEWLPAQNDPGSHYIGCFQCICCLLPEGAFSLEIPGEFCLPAGRRLFYVQQKINAA